MSGARVLLPSLALASAFVAASCGGGTPTPTVAPSPVSSATAAPAPVASATPTAGTTTSPWPARTEEPTPTLPPKGVWAATKVFRDSIVYDVVAGPDRYVAVGDLVEGSYATAWTSTDGLAWDRVEMPPSTREMAGASRAGADVVARDPSGYLAGGSAYDEVKDRMSPATWTSTDGLTWRRGPEIAGSADSLISGFARLGDRLFAVGVANVSELDGGRFAVWMSGDGQAWTRVDGIEDIPSDYWCRPRVTAFHGQLVAWGCDDVLTSQDGRSWVRRQLRAGTGQDRSIGRANDVIADGARLVAVGHRGCTPREARGWGSGSCTYPAAWTSADGKTWLLATLRNMSRTEDLDKSVESVARGGSTLVAVSGDGDAWESADGLTWERSTTSPSDCSALAAGPSGIVCLGSRAWILT